MMWWEALLIGTGGASGGGFLWRVVKSRRLRRLAADVLDGPDGRLDAINELQIILDQQRVGYEHLSSRVGKLEFTISLLERRLAEEQHKAKTLQRQLREERKTASTRIADLERQLAVARERIDHLEEQLASYRVGPDGPAPEVEANS
jgi:chromosome segregation ATPase